MVVNAGNQDGIANTCNHDGKSRVWENKSWVCIFQNNVSDSY